MNDHPDNLERELAALTAPSAAEPDLWRTALSSAGGRAGPRASILARRIPQSALAVAAVVVLCVFLVGAILPSLGKARSSARVSSAVEQAPDATIRGDELRRANTAGGDPEGEAGSLGYAYAYQPPVGGRVSKWASEFQDAAKPDAQQPTPADRFVIRKAQLELKSKDVRATFIKASMLLSEASGEYMEESSLTGQDAQLDKDGNITRPSTLAASVKLRVTATRLGTVLAQLRELGEVVSETAGGEDVTEQMVDLEARIRNEQRVETELLALLESRKGEPLEGILKLRESIGNVRQNIERMTAQRERLSRLVSLATVLVIIRADASPAAVIIPPQESLGEYFLRGLKTAYTRGIRTLADSAAWLVQSLIGGLPWWLLLAAVILALRLAWRRYQRAMAAEPAPRA